MLTYHKQIDKRTTMKNQNKLQDYQIHLYSFCKTPTRKKSFNSHSWFIAVKKILIEYDQILQSVESLIEKPKGKNCWKRLVYSAINKYWMIRPPGNIVFFLEIPIEELYNWKVSSCIKTISI